MHNVLLLLGMAQQSGHGRWTLSSSDDDDDVPPRPNIKTERVDPPGEDTRKTEPATKTIAPVFQSKTVKPDVKSEPSIAVKKEATAPVIGSEARQAAHANQQQPVKFESNPSPSVKRKRETEEAGWALSSSDDDSDDKGPGIPLSGQQTQPKKQSSPKRVKKEDARPPSPHGRTYYIDEPPDYFNTSINEETDIYRFYLNKVVGLDKKYNTGAVHIRGTIARIIERLPK